MRADGPCSSFPVLLPLEVPCRTVHCMHEPQATVPARLNQPEPGDKGHMTESV